MFATFRHPHRSKSSSSKDDLRRDCKLKQDIGSRSRRREDKSSKNREEEGRKQNPKRKERKRSSKWRAPETEFTEQALSANTSSFTLPSTSKETSATSFDIGEGVKVGGDVNASSAIHEHLDGVTANTINFGRIDSKQRSCTSYVASNLQQDLGSDKTVDEMLKTMNEYMWNKVGAIIQDFQTENLRKPESDVYPQLAESPNFYKGEHIVKAGPSLTFNPQRNENIKEELFQFRYCSETESRSFESVMQKFCKIYRGRSPVFGLFAQAGAGKTTVMCNWAKRIMKSYRISPENCHLPSANNRFQLLLYYSLKDLHFQDADDTTTLRELLFGDVLQDTEHLYDWLLENQSNVALFFDGLDQVPWEITEKHAIALRPKQITNVPTILYNILSKNLLPQSCIIISAREYKASSLPYKARPEKVFTLTGFNLHDTKSLFNSLFSNDHGNLGEVLYKNKEEGAQEFHEIPFEKFTKTFPFQHLLAIPMFLKFAALVYRDSIGSLPNSVTALLSKVLVKLLQSSDNVQKKENVWQVISKLKVLAHAGMKSGVAVFTKEDLKQQGLAIEDTRDLLLMVPIFKPLSQRFLDGDFTLFFCHRIIQEFLSACFIIELSVENFLKFVEEHLHEWRWSFVRRFVCGLLFIESINKDLVQISEKDDKRQILCESLVRQFSQNDEDLELFASIYETDDDQLIRLITKIDVQEKNLTPDAAHMISSLMTKTGELQLLSLGNLNDDLLNLMAGNLEKVKVRVLTVHLSGSQFSAAALNNFLRNILSDKIIVDDTILNRGTEKKKLGG